ncbi:MFS transporter [Brevibacterium moorei]|uniref:MFS transporter n=1 Tax=Brevibacterium moorei TaxID=2968457 RepID=UPI00211C5756|nr:MFS transporter [Brevibacterium sp. 68QC2CO]MCQ9385396.1 MFS transporter [Brevibacterium sp. 68QC2CO]
MPHQIWVLVSAAFIVAFGFGFVAPVLPQFAASFDMGIMATTVVVSAFALFRLVMAPASGRLLNRYGERTVYIVGIGIVAASTYACGFAQDYWQLLIFRALGGIGSSMFTISATALIIRLAPPAARGRATGMYATSFLLGNIVGPVVGGLLAGFGMRVPFFVYGTGLVIAAVIVRVRLGDIGAKPRRPRDRRIDVDAVAAAEQAAERREEAAASASLPPMRIHEAWRNTAYRASLVGGLANGWAALGARTSLYPLFVVQVLHADHSAAGLALTMFAIGNTASVTMVGRWSDRHGRKPFVLAGLAVLAATTIAIGFSGVLWVFLALSLVGGVGAGMLNPAQQAAVADVVGSKRAAGRVISRFQMAQDAGSIFGPIVAGWLADTFGYAAAFGVSGLIVVVALLAWAPARETAPQVVGEAPPSRSTTP